MGAGNYNVGYLAGENVFNNLHMKLYIGGRYPLTRMQEKYYYETNAGTELPAIAAKKAAFDAT